MKTIIAAALAIAALAPSLASAKNRIYGETTKTARRGDVATQYVLQADGSLFRRVGAQLCQVTNQVDDFKIAQHPQDAAAVYVLRKGGLYTLPMAGTTPHPAACPRAELTELVPAVERAGGRWMYKIVDRPRTPITMVAQDTSGRVSAWDAKGVAVYVDNSTEMRLNTCFGSQKSFSSYVAFVLDRDGRVSKIGGKDPRSSKADPKRYESLDAFYAVNRVCN